MPENEDGPLWGSLWLSRAFWGGGVGRMWGASTGGLRSFFTGSLTYPQVWGVPCLLLFFFSSSSWRVNPLISHGKRGSES